MLSVERNDGGGEGSGWFADPGIVVTNCHVVGMMSKADRPPEKIAVVRRPRHADGAEARRRADRPSTGRTTWRSSG